MPTGRFTLFAIAAAMVAQPVAAQEPAMPVASGDWRPATMQQLMDRVAIEALCVEYFYRLDHQLAKTLPELFTPDGRMDMPDGTTLQGRDEIAAFYARRPENRVTRHVSTNLRVEMLSPDHARLLRTFTYYRGEASDDGSLPKTRPAIAEYIEEVRRGDDGNWRFSYRAAASVFAPHD